jgi:hypothetical protein
MQAQMTDEEFINLWNRCTGPAELARVSGMAIRAVYTKRRKIEIKYGIALKATEVKSSSITTLKGNAANELAEIARAYTSGIYRLKSPMA